MTIKTLVRIIHQYMTILFMSSYYLRLRQNSYKTSRRKILRKYVKSRSRIPNICVRLYKDGELTKMNHDYTIFIHEFL